MTLKEFEEYLTDTWKEYEKQKEANRVAISNGDCPPYFNIPKTIRSKDLAELSLDSAIKALTDFKAKVTTLKELGHRLQDGSYTPAYDFVEYTEFYEESYDDIHMDVSSYVLVYKILMTDEEILNEYRLHSKIYLERAIYRLADKHKFGWENFTDADYLAFIDGKITAEILIDKYYTNN